MKARWILIAVSCFVFSTAPVEPPEPGIQNFCPVIFNQCPPTLTIDWMQHSASGRDPFGNAAYISFHPTGSCIDAIEVFDADTGQQLGVGDIYWVHHYNYPPDLSEFIPLSVTIWFPVRDTTITDPTWFNIRFVLHFRSGCVSEITGGFYATWPQWYDDPPGPIPLCPLTN